MASPIEVYRATRKKNDQLWNRYVMRPLAAVVVVGVDKTPVTPNQLTILNLAIFACAAALFVALPTWQGGLVAVLVLELSYLFDCADGMLARHRKTASVTGHLFDFFTDESKALLLAGSLGLRAYRTGGALTPELAWPAADPRWLLATVAAVAVVASAISLTNFTRRPELTGQATAVESHYANATGPQSIGGWLMTFLRFLNHYPSHIYLFAAFGRLEWFFGLYLCLNALYLAKGWLGLLVRFARS